MKPIKIKHPEDKIFFGSDTHRNHQQPFVWQARGFNSVEEHDSCVDERLESLPEDGLFIFLGDFALNTDDDKVRAALSKIKCKRIIWVMGNHKAERRVIGEFTNEIYDYVELDICGKAVICSHYPMQDWSGKSHNSYMIHGHCHMGLKSSHPDSTENKILDVGFDYKKDWWTFEQIRKVMKNKIDIPVSHHGAEQKPWPNSPIHKEIEKAGLYFGAAAKEIGKEVAEINASF